MNASIVQLIWETRMKKFVIPLLLIGIFAATKATAQNFWQQTNGPFGGVIRAFTINSTGDIFAGTSGGGVFRSTDNGGSWIAVNNGLTSGVIFALAINSSGHIFAGGGGVFRSTDNGGSWTAVNSGLTNFSVQALAINASGQIFAGTAGGVFRSTNNGGSWTAVNSGLTNTIVPALTINSSGDIFAGTFGGGVFRSMDNGGSWTAANTGLANGGFVNALIINSSGQVFAGTRDAGVFRSVNNGASWTPINTGLTSTNVFAFAINSSGQIFAGTYSGNGVSRSANNGDSWTAANSGLTNNLVYALAINASGHIFAGTRGGGIFRSTNNGSSWISVNANLTGTNAVALAINSSGNIFAGTFGGGVFRSMDNGSAWSAVNTGITDEDVRSLAINSSGHIFAGAFGGGVFRSTNNGGNWTSVNTGLTNTIVLALAINSSGQIFAGTSGGVFRSIDNGGSWTAVNTGLTNTVVNTLAINSSGHIFAGTSSGGVFRSTNNGGSWVAANTGLTRLNVRSFAINANDHIFAGTDGGGVFRSLDNGSSWTAVNTGLTSNIITALAINSSGHVFAGTLVGGGFRSTDNGSSWTAVNAGLANNNIQSLTIDANGFIFAGSGGSGVFRSVQSTIACTTIAYEQSTNGAIGIAGEVDCFTFSGVAGQRVNVFLDNQNEVAASFSLRLTKPDGSSLAFCNFSLRDCEIDTLTLPVTGVYTVTVDGSESSIGNYAVALNLLNDPPEAIAYGQSLARSISPTGDQDSFTFTGTQGHRINVFLDNQNEVAASFSLRLIKPDGSSLAFCNFSLRDCEIDTLTLPVTGVYTVTVDGSGASSGNYAVALNLLNDPPESIAYGQSLARSISLTGDQDSFTFTGTQSNRINVFLDNQNEVAASFSLRLTKPDGSSLAFCNFSLRDCEIGTLTLPVTGVYTLRVDGSGASTGNYTLSLFGPTIQGSPLADTPWPMFHRDLKHTGRSLFKGPEQPALKWAITAGANVPSSPAIAADGTIYVGSGDLAEGKLFAVNPDGSIKWTFTTRRRIGESSPALAADGTIYFGALDSTLYAIKADGTLKWAFKTGSSIGSSPAIGPDGTVYVGSNDSKLYAINPNGSLNWSLDLGNSISESSPAIGADGTIFIGSGNFRLNAINPNGTFKWRFSTVGLPLSSPAIGADSTIYMGSGVGVGDGRIFAVNPDGTLKWEFQPGPGGIQTSSPAIGADGTIYVGGFDGKIYAMNANGALKWTYTTNNQIESSPAIGSDGTIYVGSWDSNLYALNPNGTLKWTFKTGSLIQSSPAIGADGTIYIGSRDGKLYAIGVTGAQLTVSPNSIQFGSVNIGRRADSTVTINNSGTSNLNISSTTLAGANAGEFAIISGGGAGTLVSLASRQMTIRFSPQSQGNKTAALVINSSAASSPDTVSLSGVGTPAPLTALTISNRTIDFALVVAGANATRTVTVTNTGSADLAISGSSIAGANAGEFSIVGGSGQQTLAPASSVAIIIRFSPRSAGNKTAALVISSNAATSPDTVRLSGTGTLVLPQPVAETARAGQNLALTVTAPQGFLPTIRQMFYRQAGESSYQVTTLTQTGNDFIGTIPSSFVTIRGVEYYIRLSDGQTVVTFPTTNPENNPAIIPVQVARMNFPLTVQAQTFRMISVPLLLSNSPIDSVLADDYGEYNTIPRQWRLFRWQNEDYAEHPGLDSTFTPGNAFWLITREDSVFDVENAQSLNSSQPFAIALQPGWNQIATPFAFPVAWDSVTIITSEIGPAAVQAPVRWNGEGYEYNQTTLQPWEGYFVFNDGVLGLSVPPRESRGGAAKAANWPQLAASEFILQIKAQGLKSGWKDEQNFVGMLADATNTPDRFDFLEAPPIGDYIRLSIMSERHAYAGNFRAISTTGSFWDLRLSTTGGKEKVRLIFSERQKLPAGFQIWVLGTDRQSSLPISQGQVELEIAPKGATTNLRLIVGTAEFAKESNEGIPLIPYQFALQQNYPNPFDHSIEGSRRSPETRIEYELAERAEVKLEIFNLLGQSVRTLINTTQSAGAYTAHWDGKDRRGNFANSGVYFYRLKAGDPSTGSGQGFVAVRKLVLSR